MTERGEDDDRIVTFDYREFLITGITTIRYLASMALVRWLGGDMDVVLVVLVTQLAVDVQLSRRR